MDLLEKFYKDNAMRNAVQAYLKDQLSEIAVARAFAGQGVVGIKEANDAIEYAFSNLESMFYQPGKPTETQPSR